jgi:cytidyltransferase-like protein
MGCEYESSALSIYAKFDSDIRDDNAVILTRMVAGLSNVTFRMDYGDRRFLIRIYGSHVTRTMRRTMRLVSDAGFGPRILYSDSVGAVEEWIDGVAMTRTQFHSSEYYTKIATGLGAMHRGGFTHGDLHYNNILIRPDDSIVFIDFEFARELTGTSDSLDAYFIDIVNVFCEWEMDYEAEDWWVLHRDAAPTFWEKMAFLTAYHIDGTTNPNTITHSLGRLSEVVDAAHAIWIDWAVHRHGETGDIEYLYFAQERMNTSMELIDRYGKTVYVDGTFDLLHIGHVDMLTRARQSVLCKKLIVGIMSGAAVASYKRTPILSAAERGEMVGSLRCVDEVVVDAPFMTGLDDRFLEEHSIDVIVYGGDPKLADPMGTWRDHYAVAIEKDYMKLIPYSTKQSTSSILKSAVATGEKLI